MIIKRFVWEPRDTNMYVIEDGSHILIIDPNDNEDVLKTCVGTHSVTALLTHEHYDHICGLNKLRKLGGQASVEGINSLVVVANKNCSNLIQNVKTNMSAYAEVFSQLIGKQMSANWVPFTCAAADITFNDYFEFQWAGHTVQLYYTPGHSVGSSCIMIDNNSLFVGDSILENGLMIKLPGSDKKLYREKTVPLLENLLARANHVYPGHGNVLTREESLSIIRNA